MTYFSDENDVNAIDAKTVAAQFGLQVMCVMKANRPYFNVHRQKNSTLSLVLIYQHLCLFGIDFRSDES